MDALTNMTSLHAAALYVGLLVLVMLGLKFYVGGRRSALKVPSGETTPEFSRVMRVQLNAVEDVPILAVGIVGLGLLGMPVWYIHMVGAVLVVSRIAHAAGLASSGGISVGRLGGTIGTMLVYIAVAGALVVHAFTPTP
ncbi:MAG TPA: MAPEG family protein [Hyphomonadaceae bacterium]|nr:MAPEG family protein [Hyphomonadaceae bacterium]HPN04978.1 MAPEG family protein [Hyphomonadaceae bacterium]